MKSVPTLLGFTAITISQLALGICTIVLAARMGGKAKISILEVILTRNAYLFRYDCLCEAQPFPPIPLDAYHLCVFYRHRVLELACISISLLYGTLQLRLNSALLIMRIN